MKLKKRRQYVKSKQTEPSLSSKPSTPLPSGLTSCKLYQDLRLSLETFLNCLYDDDYSGLILSGQPTAEQVTEAWNKIYLLYNEMAAGGADNPIVAEIKQIQEWNAKITFVDGALKLLTYCYDEKIVEALNYWGLPCDLKPGEEPYTKLNIVLGYAKRFVVELKEAQFRLAKLQEVETAVTTRENFEECLISISKYQGYSVRTTEISVMQYLKVMQRMEKDYNKMQQHAT